jgi:hypothetical protein
MFLQFDDLKCCKMHSVKELKNAVKPCEKKPLRVRGSSYSCLKGFFLFGGCRIENRPLQSSSGGLLTTRRSSTASLRQHTASGAQGFEYIFSPSKH